MPHRPDIRHLETAHGPIHLSGSPAVMGILNVTPDSFSDGGRFLDLEAAVEQADRMVAEGAALIDVGPESTRPGAAAVPPDEQIRRAIPVITAVRRAHPNLPISIDTRSAAVAEAALDAGADIINDVSALRGDPAMADLAARRGVPVVLMHMLGTPETMQRSPEYADVIRKVRDFLAERAEYAMGQGVRRERIVLDPGIGFGKTADHNLELIRRIAEIAELGFPVLVGVSRKSTIRRLVGEDPDSVLAGSLACALACGLGGVSLVRAHDVGQTVQWIHAGCGLVHRMQVPDRQPHDERSRSSSSRG